MGWWFCCTGVFANEDQVKSLVCPLNVDSAAKSRQMSSLAGSSFKCCALTANDWIWGSGACDKYSSEEVDASGRFSSGGSA